MKLDFEKYFAILKNPFGPVYLSVFFAVLFIIIVYFIYTRGFIPAKKKHLREKKQLESDNLRIIGAFTESDPNPVIRTDLQGDIIQFNKAAQKAFGLSAAAKTNLIDISPELSYDVRKAIEDGSNIQTDLTIGEKQFSAYFYGIKSLRTSGLYFIDNTERISNQNRIIESEEKYRSLSFYLQDHLESEKERIGMELHDSIGQNLYAIKHKINNKPDSFDPAENQREINEALDSTISELREILFNLRPKVLDDLGLVEAVRVLSENISQNFKINGLFDCIGNPVRLEKKSELYLFRIIQEALSNILRHSKATEYYVGFIFSNAFLKIHISDNGIGFNTDQVSKNKHFGLLNMSERVYTLGGKVKISSSDEDGTTLLFEIPYKV